MAMFFTIVGAACVAVQLVKLFDIMEGKRK